MKNLKPRQEKIDVLRFSTCNLAGNTLYYDFAVKGGTDVKKGPVGVFDSGLGGLTGLTALRRLLPEEEFLYFADTARNPYGEKSASQLRRMAEQNLAFLRTLGVRAILVACGTLSANAADILSSSPVPAVGVLNPTEEALRSLRKDGPVAILATEASIRSGAYMAAAERACPGREILALPCPAFVPLIEAGHVKTEDPLLRKAVSETLKPLKGLRPAAVVLGCTHYGLIENSLREELGEEPLLLSAAACGAAALAELLYEDARKEGDRGSAGRAGTVRYLTSGEAGLFAERAATLLGESAERLQVEAVKAMPLPEE